VPGKNFLFRERHFEARNFLYRAENDASTKFSRCNCNAEVEGWPLGASSVRVIICLGDSRPRSGSENGFNCLRSLTELPLGSLGIKPFSLEQRGKQLIRARHKARTSGL
jgi:hypothetical protein